MAPGTPTELAPAPQDGRVDPLTVALTGAEAGMPLPAVAPVAVLGQPVPSGRASASPPRMEPALVLRDIAHSQATDPAAAAPGSDVAVAEAPASIAAAAGKEPPLLGSSHPEPIQPAPLLDAPAAADSPAVSHAVAHDRPHEAPRRIEHLSPEVPLRVTARTFDEELGNRVLWMASNGRQAAELRLDPPQLGPVEVRLALTGDQAALTLLSPHASVRDALQASLPRLQEMLVSAGIDLGSVHVGTHSPGGNAADGRSGSPTAQPMAWIGEAAATGSGPAVIAVTRGLVDTYA
jgi:flagellar hook-length control protein FliK